MAYLDFNANEIDPAQDDFQLLPVGWYQVIMIDSEMRQSKSSSNEYLALKFEVIGENYRGRKIFTNLHIANGNDDVRSKALAYLSSICHAVEKLEISDSSELHDLPLEVKVGISKDKTGNYSDKNEIYAYRGLSIEVTAPQQQAAAPKGTPPWKK